MTQKTCGWCRIPFEYRRRDDGDIVAMRRALFVTDPVYNPVICDGCFRTVIDGAPQFHPDEVDNPLLRN